MKIKISDYIAQYMTGHGIRDCFSVVGGGAMHLNDSLGHAAGLHTTYHHHEQAAAIAAEAYFRVNNDPALLCVTSGPGAINALNGVAGAYMDSIPMIVLSGQTKSTLTVQHSRLPLRTLGNQEFDIIPCVKGMTKYSVMITDPLSVRKHLDIAFDLACSGRPGPVWLDIPLDIQGAYVEEADLCGYDKEKDGIIPENSNGYPLPGHVPALEEIDAAGLLAKIAGAKRPVIYAGNAIRISGAYELFRKLVDTLKIPVVTCWNSIDLLPTGHPYYAGRGGTMGDRPGNFAVQNADLILSLGARLSIYQVGYDVKTWARHAYVIAVDIDPAELLKPTIRVDRPICADVAAFMEWLYKNAAALSPSAWKDWAQQCQEWKNRYPVALPKHYAQEKCNVYAFIDTLSRHLPKDAITVVANGSASVVGSQTYHIEEGQRFLMNCAFSSMGYDLPAAIGAQTAVNAGIAGAGENDSGKKRMVVCIAGDGSMQMNLQELQTILTNELPVKIFVINNNGYHQIRQTQRNIFGEHTPVGLGPESGDLSFPSLWKLAGAYGYPYLSCDRNQDLAAFVDQALAMRGALIAEVFTDTDQVYEPKSATKKLEDGTLVSPPLEDLAPFLPPEELADIMKISEEQI